MSYFPTKRSLNFSLSFHSNHYRMLKYLKKKGLYLAICLEKDNLPIGYLTVNDGSGYDFGYALKRSYRNQGIITEASQAVILYLKNRYHSQLSF